MRYVEGEYFYSDASMRRVGKAVWGNSVWMGCLTFPMNEPRQLGASTLSDGQESSQPSRIGQRNQTEQFNIRGMGGPKQSDSPYTLFGESPSLTSERGACWMNGAGKVRRCAVLIRLMVASVAG